MPGLEDLTGAALAESFEDQIGPQDQFLVAALEKQVDLEGRQPLAVEHLSGQRGQIGTGQPGQLLQLRGGEKVMLAQGFGQAGDGDPRATGIGHRQTSATDTAPSLARPANKFYFAPNSSL